MCINQLVSAIPSSPRPITVQRAALEFQLSPSTIFKYLRLGKLQRLKRQMDRETWVDRNELELLLTHVPSPSRRHE